MNLKFCILAFMFALANQSGIAAPAFISDENRTAIKGYDSVAYFTEKKAVKGSKEFSHEWSDVVWLFSSSENKAAFVANPEKYMPQYGGHCVLSVGDGKDTSGSPEAWNVYEGKLYFHANQTVRNRWFQNPSQNLGWADKEWPQVKGRLVSK